jgi:hypothetical protein
MREIVEGARADALGQPGADAPQQGTDLIREQNADGGGTP